MAERTLTPLQQERIAVWVEQTQQCAQLTNAALADLLEEEVCNRCDLTGLQLTILHEVEDRLRGVPQGRADEGPGVQQTPVL